MEMCAAFFTLESAVGTLKNLLKSQNFTLSDYFSFFFLGLLQFCVQLDDVSHVKPKTIEQN
jgi:hypothetical protein